jgi:hypothetical protein
LALAHFRLSACLLLNFLDDGFFRSGHDAYLACWWIGLRPSAVQCISNSAEKQQTAAGIAAFGGKETRPHVDGAPRSSTSAATISPDSVWRI